MPQIFLTNPWMLAGMVVIGIPVLIHLFLRRKKKRARFSTLQFFIRQDERASQRRKLRNLFLLALRLLICALLVFAFARPYLRTGAGAGLGPGRRQVVLLLDRSMSMRATALDGPKWQRAKEAVRKILSELRPQDRAALIANGARAEVLSEWAPVAVVGRMLDDIQPTFGAAGLTEGLRQAERLLSLRDRDVATTLWVVSDFQTTGCQDLGSVSLPSGVEVKLAPVGDILTPNAAVTSLQIDPIDAAGPHATLANLSDEDSPALKVEVRADDKVLSAHTLSLAAGATTNLDLVLPPLKPGWHDAAVRLVSPDPLEADNTRFQALFVPEPVRAVVVETRQSSRIFEEETFFVSTALDPATDATNAVPSGFVVEKCPVANLASRISRGKEGGRVDLIVLPGVGTLPPLMTRAVLDFVESGGGLLLFLGDGVNAPQYNAALQDILPASLQGLENSPDTQAPWRMGAYDTNSPAFAPFRLRNSGDLSIGRFLRRFRLTPVASSAVCARFTDGMPLLVTREVGSGRIALVNTSADTSWSDWPKHKTYVPWLHGTGNYLTRTEASAIGGNQGSLATGENDLELGPASANAAFRLSQPRGKEISLAANERGEIRNVTFVSPGVYSLRDASGVEVRRMAVNVPSQESDLAALRPADVQRQIVSAGKPGADMLRAGVWAGEGSQRELWRVLLLSVLGLLVIEMLVANRTHA